MKGPSERTRQELISLLRWSSRTFFQFANNSIQGFSQEEELIPRCLGNDYGIVSSSGSRLRKCVFQIMPSIDQLCENSLPITGKGHGSEAPSPPAARRSSFND